jgi:hypothetical protein
MLRHDSVLVYRALSAMTVYLCTEHFQQWQCTCVQSTFSNDSVPVYRALPAMTVHLCTEHFQQWQCTCVQSTFSNDILMENKYECRNMHLTWCAGYFYVLRLSLFRRVLFLTTWRHSNQGSDTATIISNNFLQAWERQHAGISFRIRLHSPSVIDT